MIDQINDLLNVELGSAAPAVSDEALAIAARSNQGALEELYLRYADAVFRFAIRRLGNRADAEDATSRVFERMISALPRYRSGSFRGWLFTIARNEVIDAYRRNRHEAELAEASHVSDSAVGPEALAIRTDEATWILGLLRQLTSDQRAVVELRLANLNDREIADVLGKSHGAVRTIQYRALQRPRELIEHDMPSSSTRNGNDHG